MDSCQLICNLRSCEYHRFSKVFEHKWNSWRLNKNAKINWLMHIHLCTYLIETIVEKPLSYRVAKGISSVKNDKSIILLVVILQQIIKITISETYMYIVHLCRFIKKMINGTFISLAMRIQSSKVMSEIWKKSARSQERPTLIKVKQTGRI